MPRKLPRLFWPAAPLACILYLSGLGSTGMLGPDEPRYASIGRAMSQTGDWVTPRLWGQPWFEKPPLLYWFSAIAFKLGLPPDWAPRLPVALAALVFLGFFWWILNREFGCAAAGFSSLILATTAGFWGFSQVGHMDLLLTATFSGAMLLALPWVAKRDTRYLPYAAVLLALGVLAKALVPVVLAAPLIFWVRRRWRDLILPGGLFLLLAVPWYLLCFLRNGVPFFIDLFWKQQFQRVTSGALMHVRPFWFYIPVLLGLLIPWTPLLALLVRREPYRDPRRALLLAVAAWGFLFFSLVQNKLPGYVLPLLPIVAALMGTALAETPRNRWLLPACALLLMVYPIAAPLLPHAVADGISHAPRPTFQPLCLVPIALAALVFWLQKRKRMIAVFCLATGAAAGILFLRFTAAPAVESMATAEPLWRQAATMAGQVCVEPNVDRLDRAFRYGLNYYARTPLPDCSVDPRPIHIEHSPDGPPSLEQRR